MDTLRLAGVSDERSILWLRQWPDVDQVLGALDCRHGGFSGLVFLGLLDPG